MLVPIACLRRWLCLLPDDSKKKLRSRAKFFRIAHTHSHSHSHSLKVLRKENDPFPDSHSLRIKVNDHRCLCYGRGKNKPVYVVPVGICLRVEFLLKTDSGYPEDTGVNKP